MVKSAQANATMWVDERQRFPRVTAPVSFGTQPFSVMRPVNDAELGGLRVRCPAPLRVNAEHTVALLLPSGRQLRCRVRVAWSGGRDQDGIEAGLRIIDAERHLGEVWSVLEDLAEPPVGGRSGA